MMAHSTASDFTTQPIDTWALDGLVPVGRCHDPVLSVEVASNLRPGDIDLRERLDSMGRGVVRPGRSEAAPIDPVGLLNEPWRLPGSRLIGGADGSGIHAQRNQERFHDRAVYEFINTSDFTTHATPLPLWIVVDVDYATGTQITTVYVCRTAAGKHVVQAAHAAVDIACTDPRCS